MKDMTKDEFRRLVVYTVREAHPGWEKPVAEILKAVDAVLLDTIATGPMYTGIRLTDAIRISVKKTKPKTYKNIRTGELTTSPAKNIAKLRLSEKLNKALVARK